LIDFGYRFAAFRLPEVIMTLRVGCCGFPTARSKYYSNFKAVEVQQTFYQPPMMRTLERWRAEAPPDFEFTLKAWQLVTHEAKSPTYRRLKLPWPPSKLAHCGSFKPTEEVAWAWEQTRKAALALQARIVVFQTPVSFQPTEENRRNLRMFFEGVTRENLRFVWEVRGIWTRKEVEDLCRDYDLIIGVDPFKADPPCRGTRYLRLHGITGYKYRFTENDLEDLKGKCSEDAYCLFNNVNMWTDALTFQKLLSIT
jgi:uncharacterized protein YecE (DUF72 family)